MTTQNNKNSHLRYNEYYSMQDIFDMLYQKSLNGKVIDNIYETIIKDENIMLAYRTIKHNKGSLTSGANNKTILDWNNISQEDYITYVKKRLANYNPQKIRRVEIPKSDGKMRPLGIPTIEDRLIQQCIKQVLEPICEAKFNPSSYGFRPNRSTNNAIAEFLKYVNTGHMYYVVSVDIKGFFDNVDHSKLLKQIWSLGIQDKKIISIISKMLKAEIVGIGRTEKGVPQGGILSPLLANIVLNELDWWLDSQWRSFPYKRHYNKQYNKNGKEIKTNIYASLRTQSKLKEIQFVRYADDFKILCRTKEEAEKISIATKQWLQNRLNLQINEEKSSVVDIREKSIEFLGFKFKASPKGKTGKGKIKYVIQSSMTEKAKENVIRKIKDCIIEITKNTTSKNVSKYNSIVIGIQNYYNTATLCTEDFAEIEWKTRTFRHNRLKNYISDKGKPSELYNKLYGEYNYKKEYIQGICLFPIAAKRNCYPILFTQEKCPYTEFGRSLIHKELKLDFDVLRYILNYYHSEESTELNDNCISKYSEQTGRCYVTKQKLEIGNMELHHIIPKQKGGKDNYQNLVWITYEVHKLVHATDEQIIRKYLSQLQLDTKEMQKLNKLRASVGNSIIR